ncbi:MAG: O-antigen ligase family protein [Bacteroidetes bacterium]|nr:O-antigen ligase family protein [Bacteroidota bacterium]
MTKEYLLSSQWAKRIQRFLILLLALRIISYFVLTDNIVIVQVTKASLRIIITILLSMVLFFQSRKVKSNSNKFLQIAPWVLYGFYLLLGAASLFWTSSFQASALQWIMDFEGFIFAWMFMSVFYTYKKRDPQNYFELHRIIAPAILMVSLGFILGIFLDPDKFYRLTHGGSVSRLGGFIINPNELGMLFVIGISCYLPMLFHQGKLRISVALSMLLLTQQLILTGSRSSMIGLLLVLIVYAILYGSKVSKLAIIIGTIALVPIAGYSFFVKQGQVSELFTLTGRIPFWQDLLTYNFPKEPWLGFGYMRIDYVDKFDSLNAYAGAMTHNTFLQVLLGLGMGGLLLVLIQLSVFLFFASKVADKALKQSIGLILIPLLVNSLTEFGIFGETNYGIIFYLFLVFTVAVEPLVHSERIKGHCHDKFKTFLNRSQPTA